MMNENQTPPDGRTVGPTRDTTKRKTQAARGSRRAGALTPAKGLLAAASVATVLGGWSLMAQHDAALDAQAAAAQVATATDVAQPTATVAQGVVSLPASATPTVTVQAPAAATATLQPAAATATTADATATTVGTTDTPATEPAATTAAATDTPTTEPTATTAAPTATTAPKATATPKPVTKTRSSR